MRRVIITEDEDDVRAASGQRVLRDRIARESSAQQNEQNGNNGMTTHAGIVAPQGAKVESIHHEAAPAGDTKSVYGTRFTPPTARARSVV